MTCHATPSAASDRIVDQRSFMHLSTGQAVRTAMTATTQHWTHSNHTSVQGWPLREVPMYGSGTRTKGKHPTYAITWNQCTVWSTCIYNIRGIHLNLPVGTTPTTNKVNCLQFILVFSCTTHSFEHVGFIMLTSCWLVAVVSMRVAYIYIYTWPHRHTERALSWGRSDRLSHRNISCLHTWSCMMCSTWYVFVVAHKVKKVSSAQNRLFPTNIYTHIYILG